MHHHTWSLSIFPQWWGLASCPTRPRPRMFPIFYLKRQQKQKKKQKQLHFNKGDIERQQYNYFSNCWLGGSAFTWIVIMIIFLSFGSIKLCIADAASITQKCDDNNGQTYYLWLTLISLVRQNNRNDQDPKYGRCSNQNWTDFILHRSHDGQLGLLCSLHVSAMGTSLILKPLANCGL